MFLIFLLYFFYCLYNIYLLYCYFFTFPTDEHDRIVNLFSSALPLQTIRRMLQTRSLNPYFVQWHDKKTILMCAVQCGRIDIIQLLTEVYHLDITEKDRNGRDVLYYSVMYEQLDTLKYLLTDFGLSPNESVVDTFFFYLPIHLQNLQNLQNIENIQNIQYNNNNNRLLHFFSSRNNHSKCQDEMLNILLEAGADVTMRNRSLQNPLMIECQEHRRLYFMYRFLKTNSVFSLTVSNNKNFKTNIIKEKDREGKTALHYLCIHRFITTENWKEKIQFLLDAGSDVNAQDSIGYTPLMYFCAWDGEVVGTTTTKENDNLYLSILEMLLHYDADPMLKNRRKETVMDQIQFQLRYIHPIHESWKRKTSAMEMLMFYGQRRQLLTKLFYLYHPIPLRKPHPLQYFPRLIDDHQHEILEYLGTF